MSHLLVNNYGLTMYKTENKSQELSNWNSDNVNVSDGYLYIGMPHTFAARFFYMSRVNTISSTMEVEYFKGNSTWSSVKNLADETRSGAITLAKNGFASWDLPNDWVKSQINNLPELDEDSSTGDGYGYYFIRISFTIDIDVDIDWIGLLWTNEDYMAQRWPEVISSRYFPSGKTDWYELIEVSTGDVAKDLEYGNMIEYELQAKDISQMAELTALKTLINILIPLVANETYRKMKEYFEKLYDIAKKAKIDKIDDNKDEKLDTNENNRFNSFRIVRR